MVDSPAMRVWVVGVVLAGKWRSLEGRTCVVVGSRNDADTSPFGLFRQWELNAHAGRFEPS